jgi:hypothetical protein
MSLALFHEKQETQNTVDRVVSGCFSAPGEHEFIVKCGNRIVLYSVEEDEGNGKHLR